MIKWQGTKELNKKLREIAKNFPRERDLFLAQEAENVLARAKKLTPVDTGNLRRNWQRTDPEGGSIEVYNNVEYAPYVEYGHRTPNGGFVEGQFFLRDAIEDSAENFVEDATEILERLFK